MKLGEALTLRAFQAQQLASLRARVLSNVAVQEDTSPQEEPADLLQEYEKLSEAHVVLVERITKTNVLNDNVGRLQRREHLRRLRNTYEAAARATATSAGGMRYGRSEIKIIPLLQVGPLQEQIDETTEAIRQLDAEIQAWNWQVDLEP